MAYQARGTGFGLLPTERSLLFYQKIIMELSRYLVFLRMVEKYTSLLLMRILYKGHSILALMESNWLTSAANSVYITNINTGKSTQLTPSYTDEERPAGSVVWSNNGEMMAFNKYVKDCKTGKYYLQIFLLKANSAL